MKRYFSRLITFLVTCDTTLESAELMDIFAWLAPWRKLMAKRIVCVFFFRFLELYGGRETLCSLALDDMKPRASTSKVSMVLSRAL